MSALSDVIPDARSESSGLEAIFRDQYEQVARVIAKVVRDPARAEELAVDVFLKLWRKGPVNNAAAWLYRVAVRTGLDELRREARRARYEPLLQFFREMPSAEDIHAASQEKERVRGVLNAVPRQHAELLLLRSHDLSYQELAAALGINPSSVGTLLSRAQRAFRKEYLRRYGEQ